MEKIIFLYVRDVQALLPLRNLQTRTGDDLHIFFLLYDFCITLTENCIECRSSSGFGPIKMYISLYLSFKPTER
jgi:hypothetical protein